MLKITMTKVISFLIAFGLVSTCQSFTPDNPVFHNGVQNVDHLTDDPNVDYGGAEEFIITCLPSSTIYNPMAVSTIIWDENKLLTPFMCLESWKIKTIFNGEISYHGEDFIRHNTELPVACNDGYSLPRNIRVINGLLVHFPDNYADFINCIVDLYSDFPEKAESWVYSTGTFRQLTNIKQYENMATSVVSENADPTKIPMICWTKDVQDPGSLKLQDLFETEIYTKDRQCLACQGSGLSSSPPNQQSTKLATSPPNQQSTELATSPPNQQSTELATSPPNQQSTKPTSLPQTTQPNKRTTPPGQTSDTRLIIGLAVGVPVVIVVIVVAVGFIVSYKKKLFCFQERPEGERTAPTDNGPETTTTASSLPTPDLPPANTGDSYVFLTQNMKSVIYKTGQDESSNPLLEGPTTNDTSEEQFQSIQNTV